MSWHCVGPMLRVGASTGPLLYGQSGRATRRSNAVTTRIRRAVERLGVTWRSGKVLEDARRAARCAPCDGSASGTWITSMRNSAELGSRPAPHRSTRQLSRRPHGRGAGNVDVDVVLVVRRRHQRVRVRPAARLHVRDVLRLREIRDVEDADAAKTVLAHRVGHALKTAVETPRRCLARDEREVNVAVLVDRDIALRPRADVRFLEHRPSPGSRCPTAGSRCSSPA